MDTELKDGIPRIELGLITVHPNDQADVDIIAVHGLGAYPPRAWSREVHDPDGTQRLVHWLSDEDMLPSEISNVRVLTFNYESRWLWEAPRQTTVICATQMLNAIDALRQKEPHTKTRPIVFIGHSFGGVVIEQAIMKSVTQSFISPSYFGLASITAGVVFLGAPLRGSAASNWGSIIARSASHLGFSTEQRILDDLAADSETLKNLLADFGLWLWEHKVAVWCFFEQHETDYGKRFGFPWKHMVVDEHSACIDVAQREALPTDHFKINKFVGSADSVYLAVVSKLKKLANRAIDAVEARANPRAYNYNSQDITGEDAACLRSLFDGLTQPIDDLIRLRNNRGERAKGTCEWIYKDKSYIDWLQAENQASLWVCGPPGIGKTMLSTHVVRGLIEHTKIAPLRTLFAFFFCEFSRRYHATDIIRSWIVQLVQQQPNLASYMRTDFWIHGESLKTIFEALCRILMSMMRDSLAQQTILLIDALDECDRSTQTQICDFIKHDIACSPNLAAKVIIFSRPLKLIGDSLEYVVSSIMVNSTTVSKDLRRYINQQVSILETYHNLAPVSCEKIRKRLLEYNGGTFLWISLALRHIQTAKVPMKMVQLLMEFPTELYEVYDRMLEAIPEEDRHDAIFILRLLMVSSDWLSYDDLAMLYCIRDAQRTTFPTPEQVHEARGCQNYCEALINLREGFGEIGREHFHWSSHWSSGYSTLFPERPAFIHASLEDYLTSSYLENHPKLSRFHCNPLVCHLEMFEYCLIYRYRAMQDLHNNAQWQSLCRNDSTRPKDARAHFDPSNPSGRNFLIIPMCCYCYPTSFGRNMFYHLKELSPRGTSPDILSRVYDTIDIYRDQGLLTGAVASMSEFWTKHLIKLPWVDPNQEIGGITALLRAGIAGSGGTSANQLADLLLSHPNIQVNAYHEGHGTALMYAVMRNNQRVVASLLRHPMIDVNMQAPKNAATIFDSVSESAHLRAMNSATVFDPVFDSALLRACRGLRHTIVLHLLAHGAALHRIEFGKTLIHEACSSTNPGKGLQLEQTIIHLLEAGLDIDTKDYNGYTPLHEACKTMGHVARDRIEVLLRLGADPLVEGGFGKTAVTCAVENGNVEALSVLLESSIDIDFIDEQGNTLLNLAVKEKPSPLILQVATLLLEAGVDVHQRNHKGETAIMLAADALLWLFEFDDDTEPSFPANGMLVIENLLDHGADPGERDYKNLLPRARIATLILQKIANAQSDSSYSEDDTNSEQEMVGDVKRSDSTHSGDDTDSEQDMVGDVKRSDSTHSEDDTDSEQEMVGDVKRSDSTHSGDDTDSEQDMVGDDKRADSTHSGDHTDSEQEMVGDYKRPVESKFDANMFVREYLISALLEYDGYKRYIGWIYAATIHFPSGRLVNPTQRRMEEVLEKAQDSKLNISRAELEMAVASECRRFPLIQEFDDLWEQSIKSGRFIAKQRGWKYEPMKVKGASSAIASHALGSISRPLFSSKNHFGHLKRSGEVEDEPTIPQSMTRVSGRQDLQDLKRQADLEYMYQVQDRERYEDMDGREGIEDVDKENDGTTRQSDVD